MAKSKSVNNPTEGVDKVIEKDALLTGIVADCFRLNIRKKPDKNADIITVVNLMTQLKIDEKKSTDDWYYVCDSSGNSGYCMKQYVTIEC